MDALGIECRLETGVQGSDGAKLVVEFVRSHLGVK